MTNTTQHKRSGMLNTIYTMLPGIDNDYAAKLVYTLEDKKNLEELQQDIADLAAQLNSDSPMTDTLIAKMLLDECTLAAALKQLRIYNNSTSISELCAALEIPAKDTGKLLEVYASFSSHHFFDEAFEKAIAQVEGETLTDEEKARQALANLLTQADEICAHDKETISANRTAIFTLADTHHFSVKLTAELELLYSQPASISFQPAFEQLLAQLIQHNEQENLCAALAARVMLYQITANDAQAIAVTSKLLNNELLEEDLLVIACRYLKAKTPQDIVDAFNAVLKKLPYANNPEENLGLAVRVLLDGTPASLQRAIEQATSSRNKELLRQALAKNTLYDGYEYELAQRYGETKSFEQLNQETHALLNSLPYCTKEDENKELACKVLLGAITLDEAKSQASYMQNVNAHAITQGLAPNVLKHYLGTQPAPALTEFLHKSLEPYIFWKSNREKHLFALETLVEELNGTYDRQISTFVLDMLERGSSIDTLNDLLHKIRESKFSTHELQELLNSYRVNGVTTAKSR